MNPHQLTAELKQRARRLGFDACGVARAGESAHIESLRAWLAGGRHGEMTWLEKRFDERTDVRRYFPGAASVIVCAMSYNVRLADPPTHGTPGKIARYALGEDYHDHLKRRLFALADWLRETATGAQTRVCVDTAPVLEREWAHRSGVGWQGKNTLTLHTRLGSYLLLGEIITTADLPTDEPAVDRCGTCTRCIDACPTEAIAPYSVDATKCISYWNIEHRGEVPGDIARAMGDRLFGCDICQEVCPWNRKALPATEQAVRPRFESGTLDAGEILRWTAEDYRERLRGSAMKRVKLPQLQRNARIVLKNARALRDESPARRPPPPPP